MFLSICPCNINTWTLVFIFVKLHAGPEFDILTPPGFALAVNSVLRLSEGEWLIIYSTLLACYMHQPVCCFTIALWWLYLICRLVESCTCTSYIEFILYIPDNELQCLCVPSTPSCNFLMPFRSNSETFLKHY